MSDYHISVCTASDTDAIYQSFLRHFVTEEYTSRAVDYDPTTDGTTMFRYDFVGPAVPSGVSLKCVDGSGDIIGFRLATVGERKNKHEDVVDTSNYTLKEKVIMSFIETAGSGVFDLLPDASKVLKFEAMAVAKAHQRKGIAAQMLQECIKLGKEHGCDHVFVSASTARSQKLFEKLGYQRLRTIEFTDLLYEGKAFFAGFDDGYGTTACVSYGKKI